MFYSSVQDTRELFFASWLKYKQKQPLSFLEEQIVKVIAEHPEYHYLFDAPQQNLNKSFFPENGEGNPFLHLGLHLGIREQVATDRPRGILSIYNRLVESINDPLEVEHLMMEHLAECIWLAQKNHQLPDEALYLEQLKKLI